MRALAKALDAVLIGIYSILMVPLLALTLAVLWLGWWWDGFRGKRNYWP